MSQIQFNNSGIKPGIKFRKSDRAFFISIFVYEHIPLKRVSYIFCKDQHLSSLNHEYLGHDTLTDILTFPLAKADEPVEAEIYISVERVRENADFFKKDYLEELFRVMIHGILHLCGYKDSNVSQKVEMREKEDFYLGLFGFT